MPRGVSAYDEARLQRRLWTPAPLVGDGSSWFDTGNPQRRTLASGTYANLADAWGLPPYMQNANTSTAPAYSVTGINGRPSANFDKVTNGLMLEFFTATAVMANSFIVAFAGAINAVGSNARLISYIRAAGGNDFDNSGSIALLYRSATNTLSTFQNGGSRASTTIVDGANMIFTVESDGTTCRHYLNGTAGGSGAWGTISLGTGQWGVGTSNSGPGATGYQGLWGEMVAVRLYAPHLRQRLEGYLAHKWGLQASLAGTHPYRNSPPLIGG